MSRIARGARVDVQKAATAVEATPLVMLVDDVEDNRVMYGEYLAEIPRYRVILAANGREAFETLRNQLPAVVVLDLQMPLMDGIELTRRLRADARTASLPIIVLTADATKEREQLAISAGATCFLRKPCLPEELASQITAHIGPKKKR